MSRVGCEKSGSVRSRTVPVAASGRGVVRMRPLACQGKYFELLSQWDPAVRASAVLPLPLSLVLSAPGNRIIGGLSMRTKNTVRVSRMTAAAVLSTAALLGGGLMAAPAAASPVGVPAQAQSTVQSTQFCPYEVTADVLYIRRYPTQNSAILGRYFEGDIISARGSGTSGWMDLNREGYVSSSYLTELPCPSSR